MTAQQRPDVVMAFSLRAEGYTGVQTHTRVLREGIAASGHACDLITPFSGGKYWFPVFAVRPLLLAHVNRNWSTRWHRHWHFAALRRNLLTHLSRSPTSVVLAQCASSALAALQVREALDASFRVVLACHFTVSEAEELREKGDLDDPRTETRIAALEQYAIENVDLVVHNSEWQRNTLEKIRGLTPRSSTVVCLGIPSRVAGGATTRASLGYDAEDVVFVNVGTFEPRKNQLGLIDVFAETASRSPRARLLLVGGDGPHRRAVERRIAAGGLGASVKLLVDCRDVPSVLRCADVYVHYATMESFGIVLLEAARAGLPIAAVPVGGTAEVLERLEGVPLRAGDVESCWRALQPLIEHSELRADMGQRARRNFERFFTRERMVNDYLRALGLLSSGSPREHAGEPLTLEERR